MKKKIGIIVFVLLVFIGGVGTDTCISFYTKKGNLSSEKIEENDQYFFGSTVAIYVEQTTGEGNYVQRNSVPNDGSVYSVNSATHCIGGGNITYNNATHRLSYLFDQADECSVYLDKVDSIALTQQVSDDYFDDSTRAVQLNYDSNNNLITSGTPAYTEYRYIGSDPSNYIYFNCDDNETHSDSSWYESHCEKWRIIGSMDTNTTGVSSHLVKIISDSIGFIKWDYKGNGTASSTYNNGSNDWSDSQLMMMLNSEEYLNQGYYNNSNINALTGRNYYVYKTGDNAGKVYYTKTEDGVITTTQSIMQMTYNSNTLEWAGAYYNRANGCQPSSARLASGTDYTCNSVNFTTTGLKDEAKDYIQAITWKIGGSDTSGATVENMYTYERKTNVYTDSNRPSTWYGEIALMYPTDWALATDLSTKVSSEEGAAYCKDTKNWKDYSSCYSNWLYTGSSTWTITPSSSNSYNALYVGIGYLSGRNVAGAYAVRPVLYLKANTIVTGGTGSSSDPYQIML